MRVADRVFESFFEASDEVFAEMVLDVFGVVMDMVGWVMGGIGEIELPETVIANDLAGSVPPRFG